MAPRENFKQLYTLQFSTRRTSLCIGRSRVVTAFMRLPLLSNSEHTSIFTFLIYPSDPFMTSETLASFH